MKHTTSTRYLDQDPHSDGLQSRPTARCVGTCIVCPMKFLISPKAGSAYCPHRLPRVAFESDLASCGLEKLFPNMHGSPQLPQHGIVMPSW